MTENALEIVERKLEASGVAPLMTSLGSSPPPIFENMPRTPRLQLASMESGEGLLCKICISSGGASPSDDNLRLLDGVSGEQLRFITILRGEFEYYIRRPEAGGFDSRQ